MEFKKIHPMACLPQRATPHSAGYDLMAIDDVIMPPHTTVVLPTGLELCHVPPGYYLRIAGRSGVSFKKGLIVGAGVIDADYRGEIGVVLHSTSLEALILQGDKIAQLIVTPYATPDVIEVNQDHIPVTTLRGKGGFGSTGN